MTEQVPNDRNRILAEVQERGQAIAWTSDSVAEKGILDRIVAGKTIEVEALRASRRELAQAAGDAPPPRPVLEPLRRRARVGVIGEVKRRSPGAGDIDTGLDPMRLAGEYEAGGAFAISVLTDARWFGGSLGDLRAVWKAGGIPVLRKDFVIDALQVTEARAGGADLVLLIARVLDPVLLRDLRAMIHEMGMTALVEVHDEWEVEAALEAGASLVGVNNRDLTVFRTDLAVTERLAPYVPGEVLLVSESGIGDGDDVARVAAAGADAVLVGEALVRSGSPGRLVEEMAAVRRAGCRP